MTAKLLFFAGSARKDSINKKLAKAACDVAASHGASVTFLDMADYDMPLFNEDLEAAEGFPENARKFKALLVEHDGFFIASPEYNGTFSALLKNAIDWSTRSGGPDGEAFKGKVAALGATSPGGLGGLRGLPGLRILLSNIGTHVIADQIVVGGGFQAFGDDGSLSDEKQAAMLDAVIGEFVRATGALKA